MNDVDTQVAELIRQKKIDAEVRFKMDLISGFGEDDFEEGTVFKFKKRFSASSTEYSYAAIKAEGKWYNTGPRAPEGRDWDEFVVWLVTGIPASELTLMVEASD